MVLDQRRIDERRDGCLVSFDVGATKLFAIEARRQLYSVISSGVRHPWHGLDSKQAEQHEHSQRLLCQARCRHVTKHGEI